MDDLDVALAAARPDPAPASDVTARHRAALARAMRVDAPITGEPVPLDTEIAGYPAGSVRVLIDDETAPVRRGSRRRRRAVIGVAAAAVVAVAAATTVLWRDDRSDSTVTAADPAVTEPAASDPPATPATEPGPPPVVWTCGGEQPFTLAVPAGFDGPIDGPAPTATIPPTEGQLATHWASPSGTIELRWPAHPAAGGTPRGQRPDGVPSSPDVAPPAWQASTAIVGTSGTTTLAIAEPRLLPDGSTAVETLAAPLPVGAAGEANPDCASASISVVATSGADATATVNAMHNMLLSPGGVFGPPLVPLIAGSSNAATAPDVVACHGSQSSPYVDHKHGTVTDLGAFPTPTEALQSFLGRSTITTDVSFGIELEQHQFPPGGYDELHLPDGRIVYAVDALGDGNVTAAITAVPVDGGWRIAEWTTSGC